MEVHLECKSTETFLLCPICSSKISDKPEPGTHAFTFVYECGTEIDYPMGCDGAMYGATCTGEIKRFVMPEVKITDEMREAMRKWR